MVWEEKSKGLGSAAENNKSNQIILQFFILEVP